MYQPYDRKTASAEDRVAWALCQIIDDDAPMRWTRYRFASRCIVANPEVMADLRALYLEVKKDNRAEVLFNAATANDDGDKGGERS